MTVSIDPSDVRQHATVKVGRTGKPLRTAIVAGLGGAGLIAFTVGAFSFFSGLADPRARNTRPMPIASNMPDLKDGLPELKQADGPAPTAAVLNLPKPPAAEPTTAQAVIEPTSLPSAADATGSVAKASLTKPAAVAKAVPQIENAPIVAAEPKASPVIVPSKAETVQARPVEARAVAAVAEPAVKPEAKEAVVLPAERSFAAPAKPVEKPAEAKRKAKAIGPKSAEAKVATVRPPAKPVHALASAAAADAAPAAHPTADADDDGIGSKLKSGIKAIFGEE